LKALTPVLLAGDIAITLIMALRRALERYRLNVNDGSESKIARMTTHLQGASVALGSMLVTMIAVVCFSACGGGGKISTSPPPPAVNQWTWVNGANVVNQQGSYGIEGTAASSNIPGAREQSISWVDASGNFWLFGGNGFDSAGNNGFLNDLWEYSSAHWMWMGGANIVDQPGMYGTQGTAASGNIPGARNSEVRWIDSSGNLWLFGGGGYDSNGTLGPLNDLWESSAGQWTWMGGSNIASQAGVYGTPGVAAVGNIPGARFHAVSWIDVSGNFWLFGGNANALNSSGDFYMNDLWRYSAGEWTWMGGSNTIDQAGTYGTEGTASAGNIPGAREQAIAWTDASGDFWLFGGNGIDSAENGGFLNDLWKYSVSAGQWTWMGGSDVVNQLGVYGVQGTAASSNVPGARNGSISWTDASANFWLFGGDGYSAGESGALNDLWKYSAGEWTWVGGSNAADEPATYGSQGVAAGSNIPGSRWHSTGWIDASDNLWLFGGNGYYSSDSLSGYLNDLWKFEPQD
jgi:hypothetical protein